MFSAKLFTFEDKFQQKFQIRKHWKMANSNSQHLIPFLSSKIRLGPYFI